MSNEEVESVKLILIGEASVGKSSIIYRYINNEFNTGIRATNGASYCKKDLKIKGKDVELNIYDTAGQDRYKTLNKFFYKNAYLVCLVYDITNQGSLESLKGYWYKDIKDYGEKSIIFAVVGNKSDLYENGNLANEDEARKFAEEINAIFVLTSAKTGTGINELFTSLAEKYLNPKNKSIINEIIKERSESFLLNDGKNDGCCKKKKCC